MEPTGSQVQPAGSSFGGSAELPRWMWLGLPLVVALGPFLMSAISHSAYLRLACSEYGLVESVTVLFLALAVGTVLRALFLLAGTEAFPWARAWLILFTVGCVYFLGEEISWGQHYFGWETPEAMAAMNEQGETNLHNIGGWSEALLDQGPRNLLGVMAIVGPLGAIWVRRRRRAADDAPVGRNANRLASFFEWAWPTRIGFLTGVLASAVTLPKKVAKAMFEQGDIPPLLDVRGGEIKESLLALFLLIYLASLFVRLRDRNW